MTSDLRTELFVDRKEVR